MTSNEIKTEDQVPDQLKLANNLAKMLSEDRELLEKLAR
ncbi:MAG: hypothetical protein JWP78_545 [Mucilaginibacter sp.]|nr:hypothetical protein [Mucilaginibacter sp.]